SPQTVDEFIRLCRENHIHSNNSQKVNRMRDEILERKAIYEKKIKVAENRIKFRQDNKRFEFNRRTFYRNIDGESYSVNEDINPDETREYWANKWRGEEEEDENDFDEII